MSDNLRSGTLALYGAEAATIASKVELDGEWSLQALDEEKTLPRALRPVLEASDALVLLDPLSFPYEAVSESISALPMFVVDGDWQASESLLTEPLLARLTPYDALVVTDTQRWRALRQRYRLMDHQRLIVDPSDPAEVLSAIVRYLAQGPVVGQTAELPPGAPLVTGPAIQVNAADPGWARRLKGWHLVQERALSSYLDQVAGLQPPARPLAVVEVGAGVGRLVKTVSSVCQRFHAYDVDKEQVKALAQSFPHFHFGVLESHLRLPVEPDRFDVAVCATEMGRNPDHLLSRLIQEMMRAVRPGGRLVFLGDFVLRRREDGTGGRIGVRHFCNVAERAAGRRLVLDHVEGLRYPNEDVHRGGLLAFSVVKVSDRW